MNRRLHCLLAIHLISCGQDSSFTKLLEPEPSAEDTSAPPVEAIEDVVPEDPDTCPDNLYSAQLATVDEACKIEPPTSSSSVGQSECKSHTGSETSICVPPRSTATRTREPTCGRIRA